MTDRKLAEHPLHHSRQVLAHGDIRQKHFILRFHCFPVIAVHVRVVEVVAIDSPCLIENLPPLGHWIDLDLNVFDRKLVLRRIDFFADVGDRKAVLHLHQHAFAVAGELESINLLDQRILFALRQAVVREACVASFEAVLSAGAFQVVQLARFRDLKVGVDSLRQWDRLDALT